MLEDGQVICVTGSIPQLGMWQPDQMLLLTGREYSSYRKGLSAAGCAAWLVCKQACLEAWVGAAKRPRLLPIAAFNTV